MRGKKYGLRRPALVSVVEALLEERDFRFENAHAVWAARLPRRGGQRDAGADFADALILNVVQRVADDLGRPFDGLYTFDAESQRVSGTRAS